MVGGRAKAAVGADAVLVGHAASVFVFPIRQRSRQNGRATKDRRVDKTGKPLGVTPGGYQQSVLAKLGLRVVACVACHGLTLRVKARIFLSFSGLKSLEKKIIYTFFKLK